MEKKVAAKRNVIAFEGKTSDSSWTTILLIINTIKRQFMLQLQIIPTLINLSAWPEHRSQVVEMHDSLQILRAKNLFSTNSGTQNIIHCLQWHWLSQGVLLIHGFFWIPCYVTTFQLFPIPTIVSEIEDVFNKYLLNWYWVHCLTLQQMCMVISLSILIHMLHKKLASFMDRYKQKDLVQYIHCTAVFYVPES